MGSVNQPDKRILITGASGLIGGRLIEHLIESGHWRIRAASRVTRAWPGGVEGCVTDISRPATLHEACQNVDALVNLSSMTERSCASDPQAALTANGGGALALVSAASKAGVPRFIQVSTYKVYGNNPSGRLTEDSPAAPQSHYAITHRVAEDYAISLHPDSVVFRLANGFGAPVNAAVGAWEIIANEMCRQAVVDGRVTIRSSGRAWRNFVPIGDVVRALHAAALGLPAGRYHLGSPESMSLLSLAERIVRVCADTLGVSPQVTTGVGEAGEMPARLDFRIDKLANAGFVPAATFDDEVRRTLLAVGH